MYSGVLVEGGGVSSRGVISFWTIGKEGFNIQLDATSVIIQMGATVRLKSYRRSNRQKKKQSES